MFDLFRRPPAAACAAPAEASPESSHADAARRDLLARIADFLSQHDLAATPDNLALIASALSGSHRELAGALTARQIAGLPIDQRWLDTLDRLNPASERRTAELEQLVEKLDDALMRFGQSARFAQDATSDHRGAIGAQISVLAQSQSPESAPLEVGRLLDVSQAMLVRLDQIAQAMERSRQETEDLRRSLAEARMEADIDHLTALPNRRAFERRFALAAAGARSRGEPLSVAFCDVDHFKLVNDTHGHDAGDRVLKIIGASLGEHASDQCFVARHGGEEFVLLLPGCDKLAALEKVDAMRRTLAARTLINRASGKPFGRITFSGGIAEVTETEDDRSALARADAALYRAKHEGRNRIAVG
ncbi:MAG: diguanylate cyclase domain-containing protein [Erythrobacter sp.]